MLVIGAETSTEQPAGRYQLVAFNAAGMEPNAMIIDTTTGKAWGAKLTSNWHDNGAEFWAVKTEK